MQPPHKSQNANPVPTVDYADLRWHQGQPVSGQFDDVYFSQESGYEETRYVFLAQNNLPERWRTLPDNGRFTIGETGFGSGLNFLVAAALWLETAPATATLHFLSVEKYPLSKADLTRALNLWPQLAGLAEELIRGYPSHFEPEIYSLQLVDGRIHLTLMIGDAADQLSNQLYLAHPDCIEAATRVDAWFLDGFAPSKNPGMWTEALFTAIAGLSHPHTQFATFTSAGLVRRGLQAAGFECEKVPGFGRKREMLRGQFRALPDTGLSKLTQTTATPWYQYHSLLPSGRAAVIGSGLAGAHTARALAESGWQVSVFERHPAPAQEASGNRQGVLYAKLSPQRHPQGRINLAAYQMATQTYQKHWRAGLGEQCGVLQLENDEDRARRFTRNLPAALAQAVDQANASALAGVPVSQAAVWLPEAGWLNPKAVCQDLLTHPAIQCQFGTDIRQLTQAPDQRWQLEGEVQHGPFELVVVCCGTSANQFAQTRHLPLKPIRGQVSHTNVPPALTPLTTVVTGDGYVAPALDSTLCTGASFTLRNHHPALTDADHEANVGQLRALFDVALEVQVQSGRVGFRCTTPDYLPVAGPIPNINQLADHFAGLRRNAKAAIGVSGCWHQGLMVNTGLGSRGLAYAPLTARLVAALAGGLPLPVHQDLLKALSPARFAIRDLIRGK
ncbi:bifunctional tRNA (5-methylaminomethyl-2-thiouridine)(34)-methyltransferase MnmD/FAD-dependent 5-carboxymethylaminomethyl-2-thiouridine(34) oxidoreductase MnmC [Simiduia agarivorans]|uniref:tRNA 5-methylaminomethyl-2-thiouridine biosynthesis bifunctional protein MnmC n=1 Tax=Simiduia agarivorans (strain DSM 21679 / JCM 13881 / BCRC 17597 / SA1) TaxID=1117647 RepID=K4KVV0_SIMAS|nr:bifunctional tRNA (5-methylaminomethyl-2-thiouridine)(34)-methyltransferase MnmD/FAD-dependent 5-carboxymethylaminomethyl-2-thiouridine(34) oxidoreductase MnmC [Simiduia agarivorans]AFU98067.1 D-amino acid oxidase family protein [Simiduia agarivorans SA1 = DSM 21679]